MRSFAMLSIVLNTLDLGHGVVWLLSMMDVSLILMYFASHVTSFIGFISFVVGILAGIVYNLILIFLLSFLWSAETITQPVIE